MTNIITKIQLSPYHKIFYNEWKLHPNSSQYNIVFDQTISQSLDIERLQVALHRFISDYFILNSHILEENQELYWVQNNLVNTLEYFTNIAHGQILQYVSMPFDLNYGALYRFAIFLNHDNTYRFIIVVHHILIDGVSFNFFIAEISKYYNSTTYKTKYSILTQIDNIVFTTEQLYSNLKYNHSHNQEFWHNLLSETESIDIRFLKPSKSSLLSDSTNNVRELRFSFSEYVLQQLKQIKTRYKISTYFYGQMILALLLHKYTAQEKFAIAYPVAIKKHMHLMYGAGVNTNVFLYQINNNTSIKNLFEYIHQINLTINNESYTNSLVNNIIANKNRNLLDVFFAQTNLKDTQFNFIDTKVLKVNHDFNIDLSGKLSFEQEVKEQRIDYRIKYNKLEICTTVLQNFINSYKKLFCAVLLDLTQGIDSKLVTEYPILEDDERHKILYSLNEAITVPSIDKTIHQTFEEQVDLVPDNIAIIYDNIGFTYFELNLKANQLANYLLLTYKIKPDNLIAICVDKSEYSIVTILAILKAGAAYVPIDPNYPFDRIEYIIHDTQAKIILTDEDNQYKLDVLEHTAIIVVDSSSIQTLLNQQIQTNPVTKTTSQNLAYVIYTSGTTGKPNGVLQQHDNVTQLLASTDHIFNFNSKDVWTLFHSYVFDFTIWEIWGALFYGGKLVIPTQIQIRDFEQFYTLCKDNGVTVLNQTPSAFYQFSNVAIQKAISQQLITLRYIIFGGETLNLKQLKSWFDCYGDTPQLINMYGITETTVHVTYKAINAHELINSSLVGTTIPDQKAYILDKKLELLPIGAIGELYVGGARLARGYLNQPDLTCNKFIKNPFKINDCNFFSDRLYKTGDLMRMLPDSSLEYIGRSDLQVKIRGYRIELGEVENVLSSYPGITHAIVIVSNNTNSHNKLNYSNYLVGYYVAQHKLAEENILAFLNQYLPHYMLPHRLIQIDKLPLTINGKLDKQALPVPTLTNSINYMASRNKLEIK